MRSLRRCGTATSTPPEVTPIWQHSDTWRPPAGSSRSGSPSRSPPPPRTAPSPRIDWYTGSGTSPARSIRAPPHDWRMSWHRRLGVTTVLSWRRSSTTTHTAALFPSATPCDDRCIPGRRRCISSSNTSSPSGSHPHLVCWASTRRAERSSRSSRESPEQKEAGVPLRDLTPAFGCVDRRARAVDGTRLAKRREGCGRARVRFGDCQPAGAGRREARGGVCVAATEAHQPRLAARGQHY